MNEAHPGRVPGFRDDVHGWLTEAQAAMLAAAAAAVPPGGTIVEIGSFQGRSTLVLAAGAPAAVVVAIDPHAGNDRGPQEIDGYVDEATADRVAFERNLERAGVRARVRHVAAFSADAHAEVAGSIDLLYIDGAHRYTPARDDVHDWGIRVGDGGAMLIHDSFSSVGVTLAIARELLFGRRFRFVGRSRSLAHYRADLPSGFAPRAANSARQLWQLGWFAANVAVKVLISAGLGRLLERHGRRTPEWPY